MKKSRRTIKTAVAGVALITLAACSAKLLWSTTWETGKPLFAGALAVDSANNSYVGGAERTELDESGYLLTFAGVLAKHDAQGKLLWQTHLDADTSVAKVVVLSEDYLAVVTRALSEESLPRDAGPGALWLVSAQDGTFLSELESFDALLPLHVRVANGRLYVVKSAPPPLCDSFGWCDPSAVAASEITTYDMQGNLLQTRSLGERNVKDVGIDSAGDVYVLLWYTHPRLLKLNDALSDVWAVDTLAAGCNGHELLVGDSSLYVDCGNGVLQVSAQGQQGAYTSFESELKQYPANTDEPDWQQGYEERSEGVVAANGDLYIAKARYKLFASWNDEASVGPLTLPQPSLMEIDTVIFKVTGGTGGITWTDDINTPLFADADSVVTHFYYPLALHLAGDKVRLTYRGFSGDYGGVEENQCWDVSDLGYLLNTCRLIETRQRYAKTQDYRSTDGKRLQDVRYDVPYPRAVVQDSTGSLLLAGDDMRELPSHFNEIFTFGFDLETITPVEQSQIYLQKSKP